MARTGNKSAMKTHDDHGNMIDDEAIDTFVSALDALHKDEWRARTLAFEALIETLPGSGAPPPFVGSSIIPWYKSYTALRKLAKPVSSLLLNARSTVVKHTTQHLAFLVQKVKEVNPPNSDTCKYLLKDLLSSVLAMHAQTVAVIQNYALEMMTLIFPLCRFKSGLPVLLERLRKDKSRDVRVACIVYLRMITKYWSSPAEAEYLTTNICTHIGNGLARALMDPAQSVRTEARNAFELYRHRYPELWNEIVQKPDGIFSKDSRMKKSIMNAAMKADADGNANLDEYSASYEEGEEYDARTLGSTGSKGSWNSTSSFMSKNSKAGPGLRAAARSTSRTRGMRGPPMRTNNGTLPPASKRAQGGASPSPVRTPVNRTNDGIKPVTPTRKARDDAENTPPAVVPVIRTTPSKQVTSTMGKKPNESYLVSNQLLAAHKNYIDDLMESLRTEMNTVRDFETSLVKSQNNPKEDGTYGPTEDEVLKYYEAVYAYLDRGAENSTKLRHEMERISRTEFQSGN